MRSGRQRTEKAGKFKLPCLVFSSITKVLGLLFGMENQYTVRGAFDLKITARDFAALSAGKGVFKGAFLLHDVVRHA